MRSISGESWSENFATFLDGEAVDWPHLAENVSLTPP